MPQPDLDTLVSLVDAYGMENCLLGLADYCTQRRWGTAQFHFDLGALAGLARKIEKP